MSLGVPLHDALHEKQAPHRDGRLSNGQLARGSFLAQRTARGQPRDRAPDS
jgi:hypothetical protein